ncbi:hypothetical protein NODU109028_09905 [Nocardioides dubius]|uniref:Addiction module protein n=1 Tax=Nocardioides dubius TaxID=317019 RepID=A0ABP4EAA0_9ACTN
MTVPAEVLDLVLGLPDAVQDELVMELAARRQAAQETLHPAWSAEIASRVDDIVGERVQTVPMSEIKAELAALRPVREA